mgnify:CR=1 FL=1
MKKNDYEMEWVPSKEWVPSQIVNTPDDSKYASIVDFARDSLTELDGEPAKYFAKPSAEFSLSYIRNFSSFEKE